jgi:hypothetical protein
MYLNPYFALQRHASKVPCFESTVFVSGGSVTILDGKMLAVGATNIALISWVFALRPRLDAQSLSSRFEETTRSFP